MSQARILIIEDEQLIRWSLRQRFEDEGFIVEEAESGEEGITKLSGAVFDLVMLDHKLPGITGLETLRQIRERDAELVVVMMTAYSNVDDAVEAMRLGAYDYVSKPFKMDELIITVTKALETTRLKREVRDFRASVRKEFGFDRILGASPSMTRLFGMVKDVAGTGSSTIFLRGESGTGKDLVAKAIHYNSDRANRPFMNITCTAISESLLESELFGHERGAFTDAKAMKRGLFELADRGTVFLDEVGDMPPALQAKLLRFLEEKRFRRVGGVHDIEVDVRIIAATNREIEELIEEGKFRQDLYYRLNIIPITLPPLRERDGDIKLIAEFYVDKFARELRKGSRDLSKQAIKKLSSYPWPGNVRELRNVIERAVLFCKEETIDADDLNVGPAARPQMLVPDFIPEEGISLQDIEEKLVRLALKQTDNNQTRSAKLLNISRDQLRYRMERYGLL